MSYKEDIKKILLAGVQAPSGDNSQPWIFEIGDNRIDIFNLPKKDNPILNFKQRGSYLAHGALIENIVIGSSKYGYDPKITLFPKSGLPDHVASIDLTEIKQKNDYLYRAIFQRCTNRKKYQSAPLDKEQRNDLSSVVKGMKLEEYMTLKFVEESGSKLAVGRAVASIEQVILENKKLHALLFHDVVWTEKEEKRIKEGLYIGTMEFSLPQKAAFYLASHWSLMRLFKVLGLPKLIVNDDAKLYSTGAVLGAVVIDNETDVDFINAGRIMQRIWLKSTQYGLAFQPVTALVFAAQRVFASEADIFSPNHRKIIEINYNIMRQSFGVKNGTIATFFRIGHASPPSARSSRKMPTIGHDGI